MAEINFNVNPNDLFKGGFEPVPADRYTVVVIDSDVVVPNSGNGRMAKLVYEIIGNKDYEGRKIYDNIVFEHPVKSTEVMGVQRLNSVGTCCGLPHKIRDTAELHGKAMDVSVGVKNSKDYGDQNFIKKYLPRASAQEEKPQDAGAVKTPSFIKK
jgi:hypothetical protein